MSGNDCSGGFVGRSANAVVAGALSSLGIELMGNFPVNTVMLNCRIDGTVNVSAQEVSLRKVVMQADLLAKCEIVTL